MKSGRKQPSRPYPLSTGQQPGGNGALNDEVDLFAFLGVLVRQRRMIVKSLAIAFAVLLLIAFLWPPTYTAKATLLPPDSGEYDRLSTLMRDTPFSGLPLPAQSTNSELFVEILRSRSVGAGVLHHRLLLDSTATTLMDEWQMESEAKALKKLYARITLSATEQGIIEISAAMRTPELAAAVANAFVAELDRVNQSKNVSSARNARRYIETQLEQTSKEVALLADSLAAFQARYGAIGLSAQMEAMLEQAGHLKGNLIAEKIKLELMSSEMKASNPELIQKRAEIEAMERQYRQLQFGSQAAAEESDYLISLRDLPGLARTLAELTRDLKVKETVWELLNQQYYQIKIQEAKDTPTVQVLDTAVPPEFRTHPKRLLILIVGEAVVLIFTLIAAFVLEYVRGVRQNESEWRRWQALVTGSRKTAVPPENREGS